MKKGIIVEKLKINIKKQKNINYINIMELITVISVLARFKFFKAIKILLGYYGAKYSIKIATEANEQVTFENTIIGHTISIACKFYSDYIDEIKAVINDIYLILAVIIFDNIEKYLPSIVIELFKISKNLKIYSIVFYICKYIYKLIKDLIRIYCY